MFLCQSDRRLLAVDGFSYDVILVTGAERTGEHAVSPYDRGSHYSIMEYLADIGRVEKARSHEVNMADRCEVIGLLHVKTSGSPEFMARTCLRQNKNSLRTAFTCTNYACYCDDLLWLLRSIHTMFSILYRQLSVPRHHLYNS